MWTCISQSDFDDFLAHYPSLYPFSEDIKLHCNEEAQIYVLPRLFYKTYYHKGLKLYTNSSFEPKQMYDDKDPVIFNAVLRPEQKRIADKTLRLFKNQGYINGIIEARPGTGKTVLSIYISIELNKRPLIIVDNNKLVSQWKEEILKFTNITEDQIGIIKGNKLQIADDKKIVIAMVQTLISRVKTDLKTYYDKFHKAGFDLVFYDECHKTTSGPRYATASLLLNTKNIIGLSATPFVDQLNKVLLFNTIGHVYVKSKQYEISPEVTFIKYHSRLDQYIERKEFNSLVYLLQRDILMGNSKYNKHIHKSKEYLNLIHKLVKQLYKKERIIIITQTKIQVESISKYLTNHGIDNIMFYSKQQNVDKEKDRVLVATYKFASHGFDYKQLSTIILACNLFGKKSLIQCVGRILRECEGKYNAYVFDLIDLSIGSIFVDKVNRKKSILANEIENCQFKEVNA